AGRAGALLHEAVHPSVLGVLRVAVAEPVDLRAHLLHLLLGPLVLDRAVADDLRETGLLGPQVGPPGRGAGGGEEHPRPEGDHRDQRGPGRGAPGQPGARVRWAAETRLLRGVRTLLGHGGSTLPSTRTPSHLRYATRSHFTRSIAVAKSDASKSSRNARSGDPSKRAANEKAIKEVEAQER